MKTKRLFNTMPVILLALTIQGCGDSMEAVSPGVIGIEDSMEIPEDHVIVGDMVVNKSMIVREDLETFWPEKISDSDATNFQATKSNYVRTWPEGKIALNLKNLTVEKKRWFLEVCAEIEAAAGITCQVRHPMPYNYVNVIHHDSCSFGGWSFIGLKKGKQNLCISKSLRGSTFKSVAMHELLHALGFSHEHTRKDRWAHVKVHWENIRENQKHNFARLNSESITYGRYSPLSIMHYHRHSFSKNGQPTLTLLKSESQSMGGRSLHATDIEGLVKVYGQPKPPSGRVIGWLDRVAISGDKVVVSGWACEVNLKKSIPVHLYVGGPAGQGKFIGAYTANATSEAAVERECGTGMDRHRYRLAFDKEAASKYKGQRVYMHGISKSDSAPNPLLRGSGSHVVP